MADRWYELERYVGQQWVLDAVTEHKEIAIAEAERLIACRRAVGVRVVQMADDGRPPQTVFRKSVIDEDNRAALIQRARIREEVLAARWERAERRRQRIASMVHDQSRRIGALAIPALRRITALAALCAAVAAAGWWLWQGLAPPRLALPIAGERAGIGVESNTAPVIHWGGVQK